MILNEKSVRYWLEEIRKFWRLYEWLGNCFVLDHFVDRHWEKLPGNWRDFLEGLTPTELNCWISLGTLPESVRKVAPLSLLALRAAVNVLSINRSCGPVSYSSPNGDLTLDDKILKLLQRHVKPKKRHEIEQMAKLVVELSSRGNNVKNLMDIGSGLGHLCRFMSYGLGFNTFGIDADGQLGSSANQLNQEVAKEIRKKKDKALAGQSQGPLVNPDQVISEHLNQILRKDESVPSLPSEDYGLIGLHGCGDLGGVIIQNFVANPQVRFLCFVSCCYMKIRETYPLSAYLNKNLIPLSYEPLELACHAKEIYMERLKDSEQVEKLKTHCYRATLETIVQKYGFVREGLSIKSIKNYHHLEFSDYAVRATERLNIRPTDEEINDPQIAAMLGNWMQVVYFYTLRVLIAPVIETAVLLDRALFIIENGHECELRPIFDPVKSPRNTVLIGTKDTTAGRNRVNQNLDIS